MPADHLAMSDEDFLKQPEPTGAPVVEQAPQVETPAPVATEQAPVVEDKPTEPKVEEPKVEEKVEEKPAAQPTDEEVLASVEGQKAEQDKKPAEGEAPKEEVKPEDKPAEVKPEEKKPDDKPADPTGSEAKPEGEFKPPSAEEAQAFFMKVMTPIKANGKTIQLKSPDEAIALMQMGANYTRKLQEIAPHRKLITMLGNNDLLDESKINFLIDLDKKDPEAIKKLIKDSGIDILDIDTNVEPAYREGSHRVTDEEVNFRTTLDELSSTDAGKQTLIEVNSSWDQTSKDMAWATPDVLTIIHEQRENGIYAKITEEMNRQKTLGKIAPTVPFLEAYKIVGDQLHAAGAFGTPVKEEAPEKPVTETVVPPVAAKPVPVATRAAAPKPVVEADDKVAAASPTRAAPGKAAEVKNFLSMSDEDFLNSDAFKGRV